LLNSAVEEDLYSLIKKKNRLFNMHVTCVDVCIGSLVDELKDVEKV
jgi:hypothetical protein